MGFSGGSSSSGSANIDAFVTQQLQQDIKILELKAAGSAAAGTYETMFLDIFSDADGYSNTIAAGSTTAIFSTNKYVNGGTLATDALQTDSWDGTSSNTNSRGAKIYAKANCTLVSVLKAATCTATRARLFTSAGVLLSTASFSGNTATFTTGNTLTATSSYYLEADNSGAAYDATYKTTTMPVNSGTYINWVCESLNQTDGNTNNYNFVSVSVGNPPSNKIVQTNAITCPTPTGYQVYADKTTAGSGAVTYDISFDNGSHYYPAQSLNTKYPIGAYVGTQMIIKLNLNGVGTGNTAEASNYAVMLWTT